MWQYQNTDELYHYGVLGMKWGVRRYQNADGSLTSQGKKHYNKISPDKLNKTMKKEVRKARQNNGEMTGLSNKFIWSNTIGENSKKATTEHIKKMNNIDKKYNKKYANLDKQYKDKKISYETYINREEKIHSNHEKERKQIGALKVLGESYSKGAIEHIGEVNIAYLKDLGYNDSSSNYINDRLKKSKRVSIY